MKKLLPLCLLISTLLLATASATAPVWTKTIANFTANNEFQNILGFPNTVVVFGSNSFLGLDAATGTIKYGPITTAVMEGFGDSFGSCSGKHVVIAIGGDSNNLFAFDADTGALLWKNERKECGSLSVGPDGCSASFVAGDGFTGNTLVTVDVVSGHETHVNPVGCGGVSAVRTATLLAGISMNSCNSYVAAADIVTGETKWISKILVNDEGVVSRDPKGDVVYVAGNQPRWANGVNAFAALDAKSGNILWNNDVGGAWDLTKPVVVGDSYVCVGGMVERDNITCVDKNTGATQFTHSTRGSVNGFGASGSTLYAAVFPLAPSPTSSLDMEAKAYTFSLLGANPAEGNVQLLATHTVTTDDIYAYSVSNAVYIPARGLVLFGVVNGEDDTTTINAYRAN